MDSGLPVGFNLEQIILYCQEMRQRFPGGSIHKLLLRQMENEDIIRK